MILLFLVFSGGVQNDFLYLLIVGFAFFLILIGILWHYKQQIGGTILVILLLFIIFYIVAFMCMALGIGTSWRLGAVTMLFIIAYAFWITPTTIKSEFWKFIVFIIIMLVAYTSGFLPAANDWADKLMGFIRG
jgi:hypothetical protein